VVTYTAVLLGLEDETVTTMAIPMFMSTLKMALPPKLPTAYYDPALDNTALTIHTVEFDFDRAETLAAQLIDPSVVIYRRRRPR
jgi:hypothetical protein